MNIDHWLSRADLDSGKWEEDPEVIAERAWFKKNRVLSYYAEEHMRWHHLGHHDDIPITYLKNLTRRLSLKFGYSDEFDVLPASEYRRGEWGVWGGLFVWCRRPAIYVKDHSIETALHELAHFFQWEDGHNIEAEWHNEEHRKHMNRLCSYYEEHEDGLLNLCVL